MDASAEDVAALSFEDALKRLEQIVQQLEGGEVPLADAIAIYAEGDRLRAQCEHRLADAQARIERIQTGADGRASGVAPFDGR